MLVKVTQGAYLVCMGAMSTLLYVSSAAIGAIITNPTTSALLISHDTSRSTLTEETSPQRQLPKPLIPATDVS